jgi:SOS-response transcriptional repressor LexA
MNFEECLTRLRKYYKPSNAEIEKSLGLSNGYISKIKENPGKLLLVLSKNGISTDWFLTGEGEMFLSKPKDRPLQVEIPSLGIQIDQRLEKLEAQIAEIKGQVVEMRGQIGKKGMNDPESGMFVSESEPEYGEGEGDITLVEGIAAGKPIYQSDARSTIRVPMRYIKTKPEDYYVGRIKGTSMIAAGIPDGCLALFRISDVPRDGAIQIVEWQGEATLKRIREVPGKGWKICFDDYTGRYIEVGPGEDPQIQGDFIAVLPEKD